jgi:hypothetical protein
LLPERPATALNKVTLYPDSTFFTHSSISYEEGTLFEIIHETRFEYEDDAQNQKFKWFQVKTPDNKIGWLYGDGIAVILPESEVIPLLKPHHLNERRFSPDAEASITWVAATLGRDNFHKEDYLNPLYKEYYLIITNPLGKSYPIQLSAESAMGSSEVRKLMIKDLTDDNIPELLLLKSSFDNGNPVENREVEIYAFQAGSFSKVFEERMNLKYQHKRPSPALFKFVEIHKKNIRIAYVDYIDCKDYTPNLLPKTMNEKQERCLEYVTYSFIWDTRKKKYVSLYEESRTTVTAHLNKPQGFLRSEPSYLSEVTEKLTANAPLKIIQQYEKIIHQRGVKKIVPYFYAQSANGNYGYIHAKDILFSTKEHATILNRFYKNPTLNRDKWQQDTSFLSINLDDNPVIVSKKG